MEIDLVYPERREDAFDAECVIAAVFFDNDELLSFGVDSNSWELDDAFENNFFYEMVEPLDHSDGENRLSESVRVKLKQGTIIGHHPFRFYAIEVEEKKCYLITGATIKVHKDMGKAENTKIELKKLEYTLDHLNKKKIDTKEVFVTQAL